MTEQQLPFKEWTYIAVIKEDISDWSGEWIEETRRDEYGLEAKTVRDSVEEAVRKTYELHERTRNNCRLDKVYRRMSIPEAAVLAEKEVKKIDQFDNDLTIDCSVTQDIYIPGKNDSPRVAFYSIDDDRTFKRTLKEVIRSLG